MNITKLSIVGYWELVKFEAIADDGDIIYPFGQYVRGLLHYADNELMSAQLGSTMRANFENEDFNWTHKSERI
jgi:hypothetical protein